MNVPMTLFIESLEIERPKVTIALPVYNGAEHLEEALLSLQRQTYPNFEITICDNVSTDETGEIAERFAREDPRFIYVRQTVFLAANENFIRAYRLTDQRAKYFLWACDDNIWDPNFLKRTVTYMELTKSCSACGFYLHHFGDGDVREVGRPILGAYKAFRLLQFAFERNSVMSLYALMRRAAIDSIRFELGSISAYPDRYYMIQLRTFGHFHVVEEDLLAFRDGGISSTGDDPWVRTVIDMNFSEREFELLFSLPRLTGAEKVVLAWKFSYIALRHNIPDVVHRWWLSPVHLIGRILNAVRPSPWRVTERGLQRVGR